MLVRQLFHEADDSRVGERSDRPDSESQVGRVVQAEGHERRHRKHGNGGEVLVHLGQGLDGLVSEPWDGLGRGQFGVRTRVAGIDLVSTAASEDHLATVGGHVPAHGVERLLVEGSCRVVRQPLLPYPSDRERRVLHSRYGGVMQPQVIHQHAAPVLLEPADPASHEQPERVDRAETGGGG